MKTISVGINGFGRFGLHLLRYWIVNYEAANFAIEYVNDDHLTLDQVAGIIRGDPHLDIKENMRVETGCIQVKVGSGWFPIKYSNQTIDSVPWLGDPQIFLECSGKHTNKNNWDNILQNNTCQVIISATSWQAGQIVIYGFNHSEFDQSPVVSYGSCTINAYVPLAAAIHERFGILDSDVNIIHNIPEYRRSSFDTLLRKSCTLEEVAPHLLRFLSADRFRVNYTVVPYTGVSIIDYRFRIGSKPKLKDIHDFLAHSVEDGPLKGLYGLQENDRGPNMHKFTSNSAEIIASNIVVAGDNLYLHAYFDNENSVNRYFDVVNFICQGMEE